MFTKSDYPEVMEAILRTMEQADVLTSTTRNAFFRDLRIDFVGDAFLGLSTADEESRSTILSRYKEPLEAAASDVFRSPMKIDVVLREPEPLHLPGQGTTISPLARAEELRAEHEEQEKKTAAGETSMVDSAMAHNYTFDTFIVGSSNKFAHAAALAVADEPGKKYNPLFIYGPSGLGKTHLMFAIVNKLRATNPDVKAIYITGEDFTNQMVASIQNNTPEAFRHKFRTVDVLLIDDIQFISGKSGTQEEFFHTFNALYQENRQIILTSDRPPKELTTLEERIRTRFEQGLITDIGMPNYELRLAILTSKAQSMGLEVDQQILSFIAERLNSSNRQLEGVLNKIKATQQLNGRPINMQMAETCIVDLQRENVPVKDLVQKIIDAVCEQYSLKVEDLTGRSRESQYQNPRNMAMYIVRAETNMSFPDIGKLFGGRNHSTVISNISSFEQMLRTDPVLEKEMEEIKKKI